MELNYFKDIFFDLLNDWDIEITDIQEDYANGIFWVIMKDGSTFRIQCTKEAPIQ